jgi:hypothetical protein
MRALLPCLLCCATACATAPTPLGLRSSTTEAGFQAPAGWTVTRQTATGAEAVGPDNFSTLRVSLSPGDGHCEERAQAAVRGLVASMAPGSKVAPETESRPDGLDFRFTAVDPTKNMAEHQVVGRVTCSAEGVATLSCLAGSASASMGQGCVGSRDSLRMGAGAAASARVVGSGGFLLASAAPSASTGVAAAPPAPSSDSGSGEGGGLFGFLGNKKKAVAEAAGPRAGVILFSSSPLPATREAAQAQAKDHFKAGEPIYARLYVDKPSMQAWLGNTAGNVRLLFDGQSKDDATMIYTNTLDQKTYSSNSVAMVIMPRAADEATEAPWDENALRALTRAKELTPGSHRVRLRFPANVAIEDGFTLDVTEAGMTAMKNVVAAREGAKFAKVTMPAPSFHDADIEAALMKATIEDHSPHTPIKAVITDPEWTVVRKGIAQVIVRRFIGGWVAQKKADGTCQKILIDIEQMYDGTKYGVSRYSATGPHEDLPCANVK